MTTSGDNLDLTSWPPAKDSTSRPSANDALTDYRARLALAEEERAERRRLDLDEQRSSANSPAVRIRAWEKVHGLRMPSDTAHPILAVIAADTGLSLSEVRGEQQARRRPRRQPRCQSRRRTRRRTRRLPRQSDADHSRGLSLRELQQSVR